MLRTDRLIEESSKVLSVIRPNSHDTLSKLQDDTIPAPQIPNPATTQAHLNSSAVQNGRPSDFRYEFIIVQDCSSKQSYEAKADRQPVYLIVHGEMVK